MQAGQTFKTLGDSEQKVAPTRYSSRLRIRTKWSFFAQFLRARPDAELLQPATDARFAQPDRTNEGQDRSRLGRHAHLSLDFDEELQAQGSGGRPPGGGRNKEADFHAEKPSNETHASTTDPETRLYRKAVGKEAKLCFNGHALMENRHALFVAACLTPADGHAERIAALHMIEPRADRSKVITLGADKAYDAEDIVNELRAMKVSAHERRPSGSVGHDLGALDML